MIGFPFWSILKAIIVDGRYSSTSVLFIQDLNSKNINCVVPSKAIYPDGAQDFVDTLEFNYFEGKRIKNTPIVFLATANDFPGNPVTIDDVLTYFDGIGDYGTTHWLRKYTDLIAIDYRVVKPVVASNGDKSLKSILINDEKVVRREYLPAYTPVDGGTDLSGNTTFPVTNLYVDMGNELDLKIFTVVGDQTDPSGAEYLDGYYGGFPENA
mgnify:CR=1 FL=1